MVETSKEDSAFFQVVDVIFDVLADYLERVAVYYRDVVDYLVTVQLKVIAELLYVLFVLVESAIKTEKLVVLLVIFLGEKSIHDQDPQFLLEVAEVDQDVHEGPNANIVVGVGDALRNANCQTVKLCVHALIFL